VARVVEAPLRPQQFGNRMIEWYDRSIVEESIDGEIDVLVVDGRRNSAHGLVGLLLRSFILSWLRTPWFCSMTGGLTRRHAQFRRG
jgi:hypothetical protein